MVAQWRLRTWRGARHVRKFFAQNLDKKVPVFLLASDASMSRDAVKKLASKTMGPVFRNPPMSVFFWFRSTGSRPHGPCASPRGSAARPRRGAPPRSMAPKLLESRRCAPKAPPAGHVFVAGAMYDGHASGGHFTPHRKKN